MSISSLSSNNFMVMGNQNKTLAINVEGNALVFFKMNGCDNCAQFEPVFVKLSHVENRVALFVLNITQNKEVVVKSRTTSTPINAVPVLILYINGRPHAKFNGIKNIPSIQTFLTKALQTVTTSSQQQFMQQDNNLYGPGPATGYQQNKFPVGNQRNGNQYTPEIGTAPSLKGIIKGAPQGGYSMGQNVEEEDENKLLSPPNVIPHNTPWEGEFINSGN